MKKASPGTTNLYLISTINPSGYPQIVEEYTVTGSTNLTKVYAWGLNLISQRQISGNVLTYYGFDGLGSMRFLTDASGAITNTYVYEAFGTAIVSNAPISNTLMFAGQWRDPDIKLDNNDARWWDPNLGRFVTLDTDEGQQEDPLSLHKYLYCQANPVNMVDPTGRDGSYVETLSATMIQGALYSMGISAPFRGYTAVKRFQAGADLASVAYDFSIGELTDAAVGAALPGLFSVGSRIAPIARIFQAGGQVVGRAADSVWNLGSIARGRLIEQTILGRMPSTLQAGLKNFPVIDDFYQGVASSIKSIDLMAKTYQNTAALTSKIMRDAWKLSEFQGASLGGYSVAAGQIQERVLVVVVENGAATAAQGEALAQAVRQAQATYPSVKVMIKSMQ